MPWADAWFQHTQELHRGRAAPLADAAFLRGWRTAAERGGARLRSPLDNPTPSEPIMTAALPIVDAHQHFWDPRSNYHPWLCDEPPIPFRYGDYRALRRPYLPSHYLTDAAPLRIIATVYVETEWDPGDPVGEMHYVERLRRETGLPTVAVAQARLDRDDAAAVLERQAAFPFVRGIRHKPRANAAPGDGAPGGMTD